MGGYIKENAVLFGASAFLLSLLVGIGAYLFASPFILMAAALLMGLTPYFAVGVMLTVVASILAVALAAVLITAASLLVTNIANQIGSFFQSLFQSSDTSTKDHEISTPEVGQTSHIDQEKAVNTKEMIKRFGLAQVEEDHSDESEHSQELKSNYKMLVKKLTKAKASEAVEAMVLLKNQDDVTVDDIKTVYDAIPEDLRSDFVKVLEVVVPNHPSSRDNFMNMIKAAANSTLVDSIDGISLEELLGMAEYVPPETAKLD